MHLHEDGTVRSVPRPVVKMRGICSREIYFPRCFASIGSPFEIIRFLHRAIHERQPTLAASRITNPRCRASALSAGRSDLLITISMYLICPTNTCTPNGRSAARDECPYPHLGHTFTLRSCSFLVLFDITDFRPFAVGRVLNLFPRGEIKWSMMKSRTRLDVLPVVLHCS